MQEAKPTMDGGKFYGVSPRRTSAMARNIGSDRGDTSLQMQWATPKTGHAVLQKIPQDKARASNEDAIQRAQWKTPDAPHLSPSKCRKTSQSGESSKGETASQHEYQKGKRQSPHKGSPEKLIKRCSSSNFADSMIRQWMNHVGAQSMPLPRMEQRENEFIEAINQKCALKNLEIKKLMKKLEIAQQTISSLTIRLQTMQEESSELLNEFNNDGESISNYCRELAEGLKGFQEHKDSLSEMYDVIKVNQINFIEKLEKELTAAKLNDDEYKKNINTIRDQAIQKEERIKELVIAKIELQKRLQNLEEQAMLERNRFLKIHADEKSELTKEWKNLTSTNQELQTQLRKIAEEKQELANASARKADEIQKLEGRIDANESKIESLLCQNTELSTKNEKLLKEEERLLVEIKSKKEEINELTKNISTRQEIESSLAKELKLIEDNYNHIHSDYTNLKNKFKALETDNMNLEQSLKDLQHDDKNKIFELNKRIKVLEMECERIRSEDSANMKEIKNYYESREEKFNAEMEKLRTDYDLKVTEIKMIQAENSDLITYKKNYLKVLNERNAIIQEKESFETLHRYLKEREEKQNLESARIKQVTRDAEYIEKYLKERNENLLSKEKEVFEDQRKVVKETDNDRQNTQKNEDFSVGKKVRKEEKAEQSKQEKEGLEEKFGKSLEHVREKSQGETISNSDKIKRTYRKKVKLDETSITESVKTDENKEKGDQMKVDQLPEDASNNLFVDVSKGASSQQLNDDGVDDEYDFIRVYSLSQQETSKDNKLDRLTRRIGKIKGKDEDKNTSSSKKIFTTGMRRYSKPNSQARKWGKY